MRPDAAADASDIISPAQQRKTHRRHQSSGAALAPAAGGGGSGHAAQMHHTYSMPSVAAAGSDDALGLAPAATAGHSHSSPGGFSSVGAGVLGAAAGAGGDGGGAGTATLFALGGADTVLQPGEALALPLWLHLPPHAGCFEFQAAWFCEPQVRRPVPGCTRLTVRASTLALHTHALTRYVPVAACVAFALLPPPQASVSPSVRYRVLLSHHTLAVGALAEVAPSVSPAGVDINTYTLRVEASASKVRRRPGAAAICCQRC